MRFFDLCKRSSIFGAFIAIATIGVGASSALAHSFVAVGVGVPLFVGPPVYYYAPPPPVVYVPSPAQVYPVAPPTSAPVDQQEECREYQSISTIDGKPQQTFGTVCRQVDGTWRIVD